MAEVAFVKEVEEDGESGYSYAHFVERFKHPSAQAGHLLGANFTPRG